MALRIARRVVGSGCYPTPHFCGHVSRGLPNVESRGILGGMKAKEQPQTPDDIELVPDSWDRFVDAVKRVAKHPPVEHPTGHGKGTKRRSAVVKKRKR